MWRRMFVGVGLGLLVAFSVLGMGATPKRVNLAITMEPKSIDPNIAYGTEFSRVVNNLFLPLVDYDYTKQAPVPRIAESWTVSADGLTYVFRLRKDVKWSDGRPVTAHDVVYTIRRIVNPDTASPFAFWFDMIKGVKEIEEGADTDLSAIGVKAIDDYTVEFDLVYPAAYFLQLLYAVMRPVPEWAIEEHGEKWTRPENIVVNGPYLLTSWEPYNEIVLTKNPLYYDAENVEIEEVHFYYVKEPSTIFSMYLTGELDSIRVPGDLLDRVKADPNLAKQLHTGSSAGVMYIGFRCDKPPFDNPLVRKAFAAATDKETLVKEVRRSGEQVAFTFIPPGLVGHVPNSEGIGIPYDPEKAREYLAQAGYPNGEGFPTVKFGFAATTSDKKIAEALQAMWQNTLGVKIEMLPREHKTYFETIQAGAYNIFRLSWGADFPDGHDFLYYTFHTKYGEGTIKWDVVDFDSLVEKAARTSDLAERKELYKQAQKLLVEDEAAVIPLFWYAYNILTKPYIERPYSPVCTWELRIEEWRFVGGK